MSCSLQLKSTELILALHKFNDKVIIDCVSFLFCKCNQTYDSLVVRLSGAMSHDT